MLNPLISVINKSLEQMKSLLAEFGMTPASRSRLQANTKPEEEDPLTAYLKKHAGNN